MSGIGSVVRMKEYGSRKPNGRSGRQSINSRKVKSKRAINSVTVNERNVKSSYANGKQSNVNGRNAIDGRTKKASAKPRPGKRDITISR